MTIAAGFPSLYAWALAAGVSGGGLYAARVRKVPPGTKVTNRMLAVARTPIDRELFLATILDEHDPETLEVPS